MADCVEDLHHDRETQVLLMGRIYSEWSRSRVDEILNDIHRAEFKVFSQFGDDGIIQFLAHYLDFEKKNFVEFGVEDYVQSNTRFLLMNNNWSGLVMDSSEKNVASIRTSKSFLVHDLSVLCEFVTTENINEILIEQHFTGSVGFFHIDIDGNDYWLWKALSVARPVVMIIEYNSIYPASKPWVVPYQEDFDRRSAHFSWMYLGCSISALCDLAEEKGYSFIGSNSAGNNAYFVRNDKLKQLRVLSPETGRVESKFRESRDEHGNMTFLSGAMRLELMKGLPVYNTRTEEMESIG